MAEAWNLRPIRKYYAGRLAAGYRICRMLAGGRPSEPTLIPPAAFALAALAKTGIPNGGGRTVQ